MFSKRFRIAIAAFAATAAVSAAGATGAASAATKAGTYGTHTTSGTYSTTYIKDVGGAGVPGYDDERCEGLFRDWKNAVKAAEDAYNAGDQHGFDYNGAIASNIDKQMESNCLVVY